MIFKWTDTVDCKMNATYLIRILLNVILVIAKIAMGNCFLMTLPGEIVLYKTESRLSGQGWQISPRRFHGLGILHTHGGHCGQYGL